MYNIKCYKYSVVELLNRFMIATVKINSWIQFYMGYFIMAIMNSNSLTLMEELKSFLRDFT